MDEVISLTEAAQRYSVKVTRLRKAAEEGRLDVRRIGGSRERFVVPSEVERFLQGGGQAPKPKMGPAAAPRDGLARVIAVAIPKGGTGKTTTTLNLGAALAEQGKRVLLIDLDPQGSLSLALGVRPSASLPTIYDAIKDYVVNLEAQLETAIVPVRANLDLVPASARLNLANAELVSARRGEDVLRHLLDPIRPLYDIILIDTLPYLGILVENALVAAQEVLIPTQPQYLSSESVTLLYRQINEIRKGGVNPELRISGILITQVQPGRVVDRHYRDEIRAVFDREAGVFQTEIKASSAVQQSQGMSPPQTVLEYAPDGEVAKAYRALAKEMWDATQPSI